MTKSISFSRRGALKAGLATLVAPVASVYADESMITRPIPVSDEALPIIGLGTYSVFDIDGAGDALDHRQAIVEALLDAGGRVIDSSPMYNRAEDVVGKLLDAGDLHDRCFLATKVWTDGKGAGESQMRRSAELMRTRQLDLMQVHNRRDLDTHWPTIRKLQESGLIRYNGVTDYRESAIDAMMDIMRRLRPQFIQMNYSLGERAADAELLPLARDLGIAVIVNRPFMAGRLFRAVGDRPLPDWALDFADSWGQFFLKFIVSHPAVTCVIPATSKLSHMVDNVGAGFGPLPDARTRNRMAEFFESL